MFLVTMKICLVMTAVMKVKLLIQVTMKLLIQVMNPRNQLKDYQDHIMVAMDDVIAVVSFLNNIHATP